MHVWCFPDSPALRRRGECQHWNILGVSRVRTGLSSTEETFLRDGFLVGVVKKLRVSPWLKVDQWWDALLLRSRDVQGGFYSKRNTDERLYASHAGQASATPSATPTPSLSLSLSLRLSANLRAVTLRKRLDLPSASSSYLTHTPRFTHATKGAFSPHSHRSPGPAGGFRSPTCAISIGSLPDVTENTHLGLPSTRVDFSGTSNNKKNIYIPNCSRTIFIPFLGTSPMRARGIFPRTGSSLDVRSLRAPEPFGHARLIDRAKSESCSRICRSALLLKSSAGDQKAVEENVACAIWPLVWVSSTCFTWTLADGFRFFCAFHSSPGQPRK